MKGGKADISVVLVTPAGLDAIGRTLCHLRNQTASDRVELVIVSPSPLDLDLDRDELNGFAGLRLVDVGPFKAAGAAFAAGVRAASAPIIGCAEEHSFPEPEWAAALIDAHAGPWAAVGSAVKNANPATRVSWAHLFTDFGCAAPPLPGGEASELPGHNTAYKREVLRRYGQELDLLLEVEWVLHEDLRAAGEHFLSEPRAVSRHLNASRRGSHLRAEFQGGRIFAANRAHLRGWSRLRRLVWVAGSPLMPAVRLARCLTDVRRSYPEHSVSLIPALGLGLIVNAAGQMLGYALGAGSVMQRRLSFELNRGPHLTDSDRAKLAATPLAELPRL